MIEIIYGDYDLKKEDTLVTEFNSGSLYKSAFNQNSNFVAYIDEINFDKDFLEFMRENATTNIKLITSNSKFMKGLKQKTNLQISIKEELENEIDNFELTKVILITKDREYLLNFLIQSKVSLWFPIKILISNYQLLTSKNKKAVAFLDIYQYKLDIDILYHFIAYCFEIQPNIRFLKWNFKKKEV